MAFKRSGVRLTLTPPIYGWFFNELHAISVGNGIAHAILIASHKQRPQCSEPIAVGVTRRLDNPKYATNFGVRLDGHCCF